MLLRIGSVNLGQVKEIEAEQTDSFGMVGDRGCAAFGYHGNFSVRLPSGAVPGRRVNLEDDEEFMELTEEDVLPLVNVGAEG